MSAGYRLLDHTADAGLRAWGETPGAAFGEAALGMFEVVLGGVPSEVIGPGDDEKVVEIKGHEWETLLVNWLAALVFHFDVEGFVPVGFDFEACAPPRCKVRVRGAPVDDPERVAGVLIKAITYHQLEVNVRPERTELQVIFDI